MSAHIDIAALTALREWASKRLETAPFPATWQIIICEIGERLATLRAAPNESGIHRPTPPAPPPSSAREVYGAAEPAIEAWLETARDHCVPKIDVGDIADGYLLDGVAIMLSYRTAYEEMAEDNDHLRSNLAAAEARIAELEAQSRRTYCAYCGHEEPVDQDGTAIAHHIATCEKHPSAALRKRIADLLAINSKVTDAKDNLLDEVERLRVDLAKPAKEAK